MVKHGYFRRRFIMRRVPRAYVVTGGPPIIVLPVSWPDFGTSVEAILSGILVRTDQNPPT